MEQINKNKENENNDSQNNEETDSSSYETKSKNCKYGKDVIKKLTRLYYSFLRNNLYSSAEELNKIFGFPSDNYDWNYNINRESWEKRRSKIRSDKKEEFLKNINANNTHFKPSYKRYYNKLLDGYRKMLIFINSLKHKYNNILNNNKNVKSITESINNSTETNSDKSSISINSQILNDNQTEQITEVISILDKLLEIIQTYLVNI